jgi:transposase-like protein
MIKKLHPELAKSELVRDLPEICGDEVKAVEFFEKQRWGDSPVCPHCEDKDVYRMTDRDGTRNKRFLWRCRACGEQYTVRIGTVYEESRLPLKHWAYAFWRVCASKKGASALEIKRQCNISYKSALFLMHRVRFALTDSPDNPPPKLGGTVEIDETYCGGKPRLFDGKPTKKGRGTLHKTPVVAMVQRNGEVRTKVVTNVSHKNLSGFVKANIEKGSVVNTDSFSMYHTLLWPIYRVGDGRHDIVNHSKKEYARHNLDGTVSHVNTCESFFSLIKRGLIGTFHAVSDKHLHRYCNEFAFRWNTRKLNDGDRVTKAVQSAEGKRLVYREKKISQP